MINQADATAKDEALMDDESDAIGHDGIRPPEVEGEADEPDAPTAADENVGMSSILSPGFGTGVQDDARDE
ncbi:MAG: hypothetical protein H7Y30_05365 [Pyrinomonadaceae bacterium]|nr:hypothetical protein [Pyrinomonadaceae bacterium]